MPVIEGLDPTLQTIGTFIFMAAVAIFAAYHQVTGKKPKPEAKEFSMVGQLADMGPVKELVEQTGLLVQQQIRTNLALESNVKAQEDTAKALTKFTQLYAHRIQDEQHSRELEDARREGYEQAMRDKR